MTKQQGMARAVHPPEMLAKWEKLDLVLKPASPGSPYDILVPRSHQNGHVTIKQRVAIADFILANNGRVSKYVKTNHTENSDMAKAKAASKGEATQAAPLDEKEIVKAHAQSVKEAEQREKEKAAALEKAAAAARAEQEKKASATRKAKEERKKQSAELNKKRAADEKKAAKKGGKAKAEPKKAEGKKAAAQPKKPGGGIGGLVCDLLMKGKDNDAILKAVKEKFPAAKTSAASIAWYRSKLREEGKLPKA